MDASDEALQAFASGSATVGAASNHAELVCLNGAPCMDIEMQIELFKDALDTDPELINQVPGP
jgi:hypothetical protein